MTEDVVAWDPQEDYRRNNQEDGPYKPPANMVPVNDERYLQKPKIGKQKAVRQPGTKVEKVGLGGLKVIHSYEPNYNGNTDLQS